MKNNTPRTDAMLNTFYGKASKLAADLVATHAENLERELATVTRERDEARRELTEAYAKLDRIFKLTIHDDLWWAIEEIARISGGESDCFVCGGCFMIPGTEPNDDVMNTPCPKCNRQAT